MKGISCWWKEKPEEVAKHKQKVMLSSQANQCNTLAECEVFTIKPNTDS